MPGSKVFFCLVVAGLIGLAGEQRPLQAITTRGGASSPGHLALAFGLGPYGASLGCPGPQPPPVTDLVVRQIPHLNEPPARAPFRDPVFGTCVVRVTDRAVDIAPGDTSSGLLNEYARVQAFNADESRLMVRGIEATWYVYDAASLQPVSHHPTIEVEPRWDAWNPQQLTYTAGTRWLDYNILAQEAQLVHDFSLDVPGASLAAVWTRYEGSPSFDGRYYGVMAQDENWHSIAFLVYDRQAGRVIAKRSLPDGLPEIDSVTISPLGNYFLAFFDYCPHGQPGDDAHPCGLMVYDRQLRQGRGLLRIAGHCDTALDAQGREVLVYQDIDTDHISMLDLATGAVTTLWPIDFSHTAIGLHFSGRASDRLGWALVSTYNGGYPTSHTWMDDQVFAIELRAGGRLIRLAHTHSRYDETIEQDYWAEPHASVNRNFTRAVFTSNWGRSGSTQVDMYMVEIPAEWTQPSGANEADVYLPLVNSEAGEMFPTDEFSHLAKGG